MTNEGQISHYLRVAYSDANLVAALGHAQAGKLSFYSCCCFAGLPSAQHELEGENGGTPEALTAAFFAGHDWDIDINLPWHQMSTAYYALASTDEARRAKLIPLIEQEMVRREIERSISSPESLQQVGVSV